MTSPDRERSRWDDVLGGVIVFLAEAAVVAAAIGVAVAIAAVVLWVL